MTKDKLKKAKKAKKSRTSPDRKKKKKSKKSKVAEEGSRQHDRSDNVHAQASQDVEKSETKVDGECTNKPPGDGKRNKSIPIKLSINVASKHNDATSGGGWGAAFAAASKVQPNDADLDDNFLKAAAGSDGGGKEGVMDIAQLASDHKIVNEAAGSKPKRRRSESESSMGSNGDGDTSLSVNSDDVSLEGRMITIPTDGNNSSMSLALVHKQSGKVYSSGERMKDGRRLVIGKIVKGKVDLDSMAVKEMKRLEDGETSSHDSLQDATKGPTFPYPTNPDDHCETPLQSYTDVLPILSELCKGFSTEKKSLKVYDPYYCDGSVVKHLSTLGFNSVYNKREDCYEVWTSNSEPQHDVFLTNPPYSDDHIEKLMRHVTSSSFGNTPWLLLMPQWVHKKDYYINATTKNSTRPCNPFYIVPKKRYVYLPPTNFREKKDSDVHKKSSPFVSMWYCWGGNEKRNKELMDAFRKSAVIGHCDVARSKSALRDLRRNDDGGGSKGKKKKKKARTSK